MQSVADHLDIGKATAVEDVNGDISDHLTEDVIREALDGLPDECVQAAEAVREDRIFACWTARPDAPTVFAACSLASRWRRPTPSRRSAGRLFFGFRSVRSPCRCFASSA
jgi:hypothetical protein